MNQQPSERESIQFRPRLSRNASDCQTIGASVEEHALGILDPAMQTALERHLETCEACAALVASYQQTAALLALTAPLVLPPPNAKTSLMGRIADLPQTPAPASTIFAGDLEAFRTPALPSSSAFAPNPTRSGEPPAWWRIYAAPLATLPLLLALGLVAAWGFNNYAELNDSQNELAQRDLQIERLASQLSNDNSQSVANLMVSPSTMRYTLAPQANGAGDPARGTLIADSQSGQAALQVSGLPAGTYAVIVQLQNGATAPRAEFEIGPQGSATTLIDLGPEIASLDSVHIRPTTATTQTDIAAIAAQGDVLMTSIGPDISTDSDTSVQNP